MQDIQIIDDATLELVQGGLSFNINLDAKGLSASGPLGSIQVPSPITIAKDLFGGITSQLGDLLSRLGGQLSKVGQLFSFS